MGFDTYLLVDGEIALDWRKYASPLPRLLFRHDQGSAELINDPANEYERARVRFTTTAGDALVNLAEAGFGWNATVAAYSEIRLVGGY